MLELSPQYSRPDAAMMAPILHTRGLLEEVADKAGVYLGKPNLSAVIPAPGLPVIINYLPTIHPLFFLCPENIPEEIRSLLADNETAGIAALQRWIKRMFNIPNNYRTYSGDSHYYIVDFKEPAKFYLRLWEKPEMLERVKKYIVTRSILQSTKTQWSDINSLAMFNYPAGQTACIKMMIITILGVIVMLLGFMPYTFIHSDKIFALLFAAFFQVVGLALIWLAFSTCSEVFQAKRLEKEIDVEALKITKDFEAAKFFFEALHKHHEENTWTLTRWIFKPIDYLFGEKSLEQRIQYLEEVELGEQEPLPTSPLRNCPQT